jgi:hypothetical protein
MRACKGDSRIARNALPPLILCCALVASCNMRNEPYRVNYRFTPCPGTSSSRPQAHALAAALLALNVDHQGESWHVIQVIASKARLYASNCVFSSKKHCAALVFVASPSGDLHVQQMSNQPVPYNMLDDLSRWMRVFRTDYQTYRCLTDEALTGAAARFGYR